MKVTIVRGAGLAGISTTSRLDSADIPPEQARELERRVRDAGLLAAGGSGDAAASGARYPDDLLYRVTVADGGTERVHRFADSELPDGVRSLVEWVDGRQESQAGPATI